MIAPMFAYSVDLNAHKKSAYGAKKMLELALADDIQSNEWHGWLKKRIEDTIRQVAAAAMRKRSRSFRASGGVVDKTRRRLTNQDLIDRFIRESIKCENS